MLAKKQVIRARQGRGWQISPNIGGKARRIRFQKIACLSQEPLDQLDPSSIIWITELRALLQKAGLHFEFYVRPGCYRKNCSAKLADLIRQSPNTYWILLRSTPSLQNWFQERELSAIVAGYLHAGVRMPSVDVDLCSMGRHAGGMMIARGHRQIAFIGSIHGRWGIPPGYLAIERGLHEAISVGHHPEIGLRVIYHDGAPTDVCQALDRLLRPSQSVSALLIADSNTLLTSLTYLAHIGKIVPNDMSIVTCFGQNYFSPDTHRS